MSRATRLMTLVSALRSHETTSSNELAARLGVSVRTLRRDLATLREQGMRIDGEAGPGGGVRLEGRGVAEVHLNASELVSLWLAAQLSRSASALPWNGSARSALTKLLASLPLVRARELRSLCRRVIVGPPPTPSMLNDVGKPPPELLSSFETAFSRQCGLSFDYLDRAGRASRRRVEPHGLLVQSPLWYVLAFDLEKNAPRMFRMDRMRTVRLLADVRFSPRLDLFSSLLSPGFEWRPLSVGPRGSSGSELTELPPRK